MGEQKKDLSRREFIKITGAVGIGSVVASASTLAAASDPGGPLKTKTVPTRPFGKTGAHVSILGLGGSQDLMSKQLLLRQAIKMGVTYWDTAYRYEGGRSEMAMGNYFSRYPADRKKVFLVTKSSSSDPKMMTQYLDTSLERLQTDYVDLYFIHHVSDVTTEIEPETKTWAEKKKAEGKIRFFGFSTHSNMEQCLLDAARLGWIDGIMSSYNYRLMNTDAMKRAVDACAKAGIGLTAMKTQAQFFAYFYADKGKENDTATELTDRFIKKGFTPEQAKLKAVLDNPNIASICSEMPTITILQANVAAVLDQTRLSSQDKRFLDQYARKTARGYCAGCARLCESALNGSVPVSDLMRYLMYHDLYGDRERAVRLFHDIPADTRRRLTRINFSKAEALCPQKMPIGKLMEKAFKTLNKPAWA
jgi:predicted aldo/keto reductase-like oxidoreductase